MIRQYLWPSGNHFRVDFVAFFQGKEDREIVRAFSRMERELAEALTGYAVTRITAQSAHLHILLAGPLAENGREGLKRDLQKYLANFWNG